MTAAKVESALESLQDRYLERRKRELRIADCGSGAARGRGDEDAADAGADAAEVRAAAKS